MTPLRKSMRNSVSYIKEEPPAEYVLILLPENRLLVEPIKEEILTDLESDLESKDVEEIHKKINNRESELKVKRRYLRRVIKRFECDLCPRVVNTKTKIRSHLRTHCKQISCEFCDRKFIDLYGLKTHQKRRDHIDGNDPGTLRITCPHCPYTCILEHSMRKHQRIHIKAFHCLDCEKRVSSKKELEQHQMYHKHGIYADTPVENWPCNQCEKTFRTKFSVERHKTQTHVMVQFQCDYCLKKFKNKYGLTFHIFGHNKVPCEICNKKYNRKNFKSHMQMHEKTFYQCDKCAKTLKIKANLGTHMKKMHSHGEYSCGICYRKFHDMKTILQHNRVHIGVRQWKCEYCEKITTQKYNLTKHVEAMHKIRK